MRLVADVGGTNTRIALYDPALDEYRSLRTYINREFAQLADIIGQWLTSLPEAAPEVCCMAIAAPPSTDRVVMSNMNWSFSCRELANHFGFKKLRRLNDFEANGYALPHLAEHERLQMYPGQAGQAGRLATVGPGTGLGGAFLTWFDGVPHSFACEPGHTGLSPGTALELDLFRLLLPRYGNLYAELLVSGPGLARLQQALGELRGEAAQQLDPAEISRRALTGEDELCVLALETFCALLGSVCGDFLLANGSYGGLYLAGGIVPNIIPFMASTPFLQRMIEKGAMRDTLAGVPVYAITTSQPGLVGAAHAPL